MSEYQYIHFLAVDRPLDDKQLAFMERQSTRAEITRWEFTNEYHFGDFRGDPLEMLRRGYDVHLHYANFGIRRLMFRLPAGLPCDRKTFEAFKGEGGVAWHADKQGKGGVLEIEPEADAGTYDELYDVGTLLHEIAPVRQLLIGGDLRPLYLAWLACPADDDSLEPPVPAGLEKLPPALGAMAEFYEVSEDLIAAAAERSPPTPEAADATGTLEGWIARQSQESLRTLVRKLLEDDAAAARAETLARIRDETKAAIWPLAEPGRTLAQLHDSAGEVRQRRFEREKKASEATRRKRLKAMAADPDKVIAGVQKLVQQRSTDSYRKAASELVDLREALGPDAGPARVKAIAQKLRRDNPTLNRLTSALRKHGLLD